MDPGVAEADRAEAVHTAVADRTAAGIAKSILDFFPRGPVGRNLHRANFLAEGSTAETGTMVAEPLIPGRSLKMLELTNLVAIVGFPHIAQTFDIVANRIALGSFQSVVVQDMLDATDRII